MIEYEAWRTKPRTRTLSKKQKNRNMNGAVLGLFVVAAIGVFLWAFLFVGCKLIDMILKRRRDFDFDGGTFRPASSETAMVTNSVAAALSMLVNRENRDQRGLEPRDFG